VTKIENITDIRGPIRLETKDHIPAQWKTMIVFKAFESDEDVLGQ